MSRVQTVTVGPGDGDQRLDRWLKRHFPHLAQGRIEKMCRKGEIRVDGGRVKASDRIEVGNQIRIPPLPEPEEVARTIYYLCTAESSYVTGVEIEINGGQHV